MMVGIKRKKEDEQFTQELLELGVDEGCLEEIMDIHRREPDLVPYECKRKYNIKLNEEKLKNLNIDTAKPKMSRRTVKPVTFRTWTRRPKADTPTEPVRKSSRIAGIQPFSYNSENIYGVLEKAEKELLRGVKEEKRSSRLNVKLKLGDIVDIRSDSATSILNLLKGVGKTEVKEEARDDIKEEIMNEVNEENIIQNSVKEEVMKEVKIENIEEETEVDCKLTSESRILESLENLTMSVSHISRICMNRISCMDTHPGNRLLVVGGSKTGELGMFLPGSEAEKTTIRLEPHRDLVGGVKFLGDRVYTCSYDGSIRMFDVEKLEFNEIYSSEGDVHFKEPLLRGMNVRSPSEILVASTSGQALQFDCRQQSLVQCYPDKAMPEIHGNLWNVDTNPLDDNYFLTSSNNHNISAWDVRNPRKPLDVSTAHAKTVSSAVFDPIYGKKIVSVAYDDQVVVSEFVGKSKIQTLKAFKHANTTGRYLTKFQARWHPDSDELFFIGSLSGHRRVEVFDTSGQMRTTLSDEMMTTIQSLVEFHRPSNTLIGANSSGKVHIFHQG